MNAFTIDADNNITVHATKKAAREAGAGIFDTAESLADLIGTDHKRLVEIWNSLTGVTPVKKFGNSSGDRSCFQQRRNCLGASA